MLPINCEDYERDFSRLGNGAIDAIYLREFEAHAQSCPHCAAFGGETSQLRSLLRSLPQLEVSAQFPYNLRRAIDRWEKPRKSQVRDFSPKAYPLALSAGFAGAILLGFLFLRPGSQPSHLGARQDPNTVANMATPAAERSNLSARENAAKMSEQDLLAVNAGVLDTVKHRLPEIPGKDQIPIPVDNDLWRLTNQASTTPASP